MSEGKNTFLGKGALGKGMFEVYINGEVTVVKGREAADKLLEAAKGAPIVKSTTAIARDKTK